MKKILIVLVMILALLTTSFIKNDNTLAQSRVSSSDIFHQTTVNIKCKFYEEKSFRRSISHAKNESQPNIEITGGISPHHLLADDFIATYFKTVSSKKPDLIFIIAPNHKNVGDFQITTSNSSWETPFGLLQAAPNPVASLVKEESAGINPRLMETDHSVSALIPYVKYFMPNVKVVPIMLKGDTSLEICTHLGNKIAALSKGKNSLIMASVDFSHYLPLEKAEKMDKITLYAIMKRDLKKLRSMGNDNLDSPASIITLLVAMKALGGDSVKVLGHSNSDKIGGTDTGYTTSYFTMVFGK